MHHVTVLREQWEGCVSGSGLLQVLISRPIKLVIVLLLSATNSSSVPPTRARRCSTPWSRRTRARVLAVGHDGGLTDGPFHTGDVMKEQCWKGQGHMTCAVGLIEGDAQSDKAVVVCVCVCVSGLSDRLTLFGIFFFFCQNKERHVSCFHGERLSRCIRIPLPAQGGNIAPSNTERRSVLCWLRFMCVSRAHLCQRAEALHKHNNPVNILSNKGEWVTSLLQRNA